MLSALAAVLGAQASIAVEQTRPSSPPLLSFEQALERALERSPTMLAVRGARDVASAQRRRAGAWENPTLEIEAENILGQGDYTDFDAAETTVSLTQALPLGGARRAAIRGAEAGEAQAEARAELAARELRRDVAIAYADAVAADRLAAIRRERARLGAETLEVVEKRSNAGLESDLQRARVEVDTVSLQAAARRAASEALARRRALASLWREETVGEPLDDAWFDGTDQPAGRARLAPASESEHPRLRSADLGVRGALADLDAAKAQRFAGVEARVGTRRFADQPGDNDQAFVIGLALPLPLWDRNGVGIAEARAALASAEVEAESARFALRGERASVAAELEAARMEVNALATRGLPAAESAARLARQGYEAGRLSLLERLEAERQVSDVNERLVEVRREAQRARAVLESLD